MRNRIDLLSQLSPRARLAIAMQAVHRVNAKRLVKTLWVPEPRNKPQVEAYACDADELFMGGAAGGGKALALDTEIPMPDGTRTTMFKISVGAPVFDAHGGIYRVTAKSEILVNRRCYRIRFEDGSTFVADAEHEWLTLTAKERATEDHRGTLRTTEVLHQTFGAGHAVPPVHQYPFYRNIIAVDKVKSVPVQCLSVDSPTRLFLIGQNFVPTHNSDLLLGLALTAHRRSIIFRRLYANLQPLVDRSKDILAGAPTARFNGNKYLWSDLPGGRSLEFGAMKLEDDKRNYQGAPHDLKAFDEICHFTQSQYEYVIGWTRAAKENDVQMQRTRIVCTGNPPGPGDPGTWVIERWGAWLDPDYESRTGYPPAQPGELRWYTRIDGEDTEVENGEPFMHKGEELFPKSRTFIPARLSDNPYYGDDYLAQLQSHPEPYRSQLLYGDFQAGFMDDEWQVIPTKWVTDAIKRLQTRPQPSVEKLTTLGVDVARGGNDQTIIVKNFGYWIDELVKEPGQMTPDGHIVADMVHAEHSDSAAIHIDSVGIGASPYDILVGMGLPVVGINAAAASDVRDKSDQFGFANKRAEMWWRLREMLEPDSGFEVVLPNDRELIADLCAPRYKKTPRGDIQIESKDEIKKRLGRSTDCGDALVMALYEEPVSPPPVSVSSSMSRDRFLKQAGLI